MTLSLRGRLLVGVISLVVVGLAVADVATYGLLEKSLYNQIDSQLTARSTVDTAVFVLRNGCNPPGPPESASAGGFPSGTVAALVNTDGSTAAACRVGAFGQSEESDSNPVLPSTMTSAGSDHPVTPFTVAGTGGVGHFRMTYWSENSFNGRFVVFAIPVDDIQSTLRQLLQLELFISLAVVAATALVAWLIIEVGLRPLRKMGQAAGQIAAGDLSRRVEPATPRTEIGRLGLALNSMLGQIEASFDERKASESRLRRFIADASHELRTPLTSIRGYSEMLRRGAEQSPEDSALARRRIEEESVRMSALVDDMLLIARLDQGRPLESEPVDLQAIARDAADDARAVAPQREIKLDAPASVVVTGDDTRLRQVLGNLVRNAIVHTPTRTPIDISVARDDGVARLTVADHGPGLSAEDRGRIFEPFYRADPSRSRDSGGAGLGLSIVSAVVSAHGGRVKVRETSGGGATFDVELPLASPSP